MKLQGVELAMSSAYHHETDGRTKVVNMSLEQYFRAFVADKPSYWAECLPSTEFWFNTNFHISTKLTPFEALYGYPPPRLLDHIPGMSLVGAIDDHLKSWQQVLSLLKQNLLLSQERMKFQVDKHRSKRSFAVGDWVYLRLQPYKKRSLKHNTLGKLSPRFYGPFQVIQKVGEMAYKLELPPGSQIHPVFHVSYLKAKLGHQVTPISQLPVVTLKVLSLQSLW